MILAIDPGLRWCGCAIGDETGLKRAALVINTEPKLRGPVAWVRMAYAVKEWFKYEMCNLGFLTYSGTFLHVEVPRIYPHAAQRKGDLNDIIELAGVVGSSACAFDMPVKWYYPSEWKGNVPKKIMTERIRKKLRPDELAVFESVGAKDHNTLDAVGIFLHATNRL